MYFIPQVCSSTVYEMLPLFVVLILNLGFRLHLYFGSTFDPTEEIPFFFISVGIAILINVDNTYNMRLTYQQAYMLNKQNNDFKSILNSFPEGILIANAQEQDSELEESSVRFKSKVVSGGEEVLEVKFVNQELT